MDFLLHWLLPVVLFTNLYIFPLTALPTLGMPSPLAEARN